MCRALYAPMRVLRLADQQVPGMEKLYYYVLKTDQMLLRWLPDAEIRVLALRRDGTYNAMTNTDEYVFDEEAADSSSNEDEEEDSDDDDNRLVGMTMLTMMPMKKVKMTIVSLVRTL